MTDLAPPTSTLVLHQGVLVEGYLAVHGDGAILDLVTRVQRAATSLSEQGDPIGCRSVLVIPSDDSVFWFFEPASPALVGRLVERAGISAVRIVSGMRTDPGADQ